MGRNLAIAPIALGIGLMVVGCSTTGGGSIGGKQQVERTVLGYRSCALRTTLDHIARGQGSKGSAAQAVNTQCRAKLAAFESALTRSGVDDAGDHGQQLRVATRRHTMVAVSALLYEQYVKATRKP